MLGRFKEILNDAKQFYNFINLAQKQMQLTL